MSFFFGSLASSSESDSESAASREKSSREAAEEGEVWDAVGPSSGSSLLVRVWRVGRFGVERE